MLFKLKRGDADRGVRLSGIVFCLALAAFTPNAGAMGGGAATVRSFYDALLSVMHNGASLGTRGRYARLEPVIRRVFDIPLMTRLAVGPDWGQLPVPQQQRVSRAFGRYVAAIYAEHFRNYAGQRMTVTGERSSPSGMIVTSRIVKADGEPVDISYLTHERGGSWQIVDVYFGGAISEVATRRAEFAAILRTSGIEGLIRALDNKADQLIAS